MRFPASVGFVSFRLDTGGGAQRYTHLAPEYQEWAIVALNSYGHNLGTLGLGGAENGIPETQKPPEIRGFLMVEPDGLEPTTSTLPALRSPN